MNPLIPGMALCSSDAAEEPMEPMRILYIDRGRDRVVLIPCQPRHSKGRTYFLKHRAGRLSQIEENLSLPKAVLRMRHIHPRLIMRLSDSELRTRFPPAHGETESKLIVVRNQRWNLIKHLVTGPDALLLLDPVLCTEILLSNASSLSTNEHERQRLYTATSQCLYQYFAFGMQKSALLPLWENCGGRGKKREGKGTKLGRPNAVTAAGIKGQEGYVCEKNDDEVIAFCWKHYLVRGMSVAAACRKMWREFYSFEETLPDGKLARTYFPVHQRPTEVQFRYRGKKLTGESASSKQQRHNHYLYFERPLPGSATDGIHAVGQKAALDSTSNDVELVSMISRLDRIGPAYRTLVVDMLYGYIPGYYLGLTPPSSETTRLAYLHAMSDKTEWLRTLGLNHSAEDWIPIRFQDGLGDNTESRSEQIHQVLLDTGVMLSLQYIPTYHSDLNSKAETAHHSLHRLVDHKFLGSTRGEKKDKKEDSASLRARHTLLEAIRDTADAVHHYNTVSHPGWVLPIEAKSEGVRPTRLEMTKWAMSKDKVTVGVIDIETARSQILPIMKGVFTESGVRLFRPDKKGQKVYIKRLRYVSYNALILELMMQARKNGVIQAEFRVDPFSPSRIWYLDIETAELIELNIKTNDLELVEEATLVDVVRIEQCEEVEALALRNAADTALSELEASLERTKKRAEAEYKEQLDVQDSKLSKTALVANKAENREREQTILVHGMPFIVDKGNGHEALLENEQEEEFLESDNTDRQDLADQSLPQQKSAFEEAIEEKRNE
ncbi:MAG: hypothetical protein K1563_15300 [Candidatus Thiodiazotropha sp. (ex. Lucinisca nassula)]|nr:hypothetical protein [Candidatus Thiodiazotropha sp. (ex. Lucinisca nassula)]MBW9275045.1 hypothetical protein [Candidatus Thiodiazotropha sp. (ex. Lucinisca nassula)]